MQKTFQTKNIPDSMTGATALEIFKFSDEGLMVDHAANHGASAAIRGIRSLSDFIDILILFFEPKSV